MNQQPHDGAAAAAAADDAAAAFSREPAAPGRSAESLRSAIASLVHDRWRIGAVLVVGLLLTLAALLLAPRTYTAEAELLLRLGREYIYKPELGEPAGGSPVAYDLEQTLQAETRILASRDLLDTVLDKLGDGVVFPELQGMEPRDRRRAAALQAFGRALDAELLRGSNLMQVRFSHRDPMLAAAVLDQLIDAYLQRRSVIFAGASRGSAQATFDVRKAQLNAADARLAALKRTRRIQAFGAEQSLLLAQRNGIEERRTESQLALTRAQGRAASLRNSLSSVSTEVRLSSETQPSDAVEKARSLLLDLKLKERELSAQFSDDTPAVQDVRADIDRTQAYLQELLANPLRTVKSGRSPARDAIESDLLRTLADAQQAQSGSNALASAQAATDQRLAELAGSEAELNALERERRLAEENFNAAAKLLRDENAAAQLDRERRSNVSIVQAPRVPVAPRSLTAPVLAIGVFASIAAALLTAFISALWRDTFLTPEQVERRLGLPVLASVRKGTR